MRTLSPLFLAFATLFGATGLYAATMNKCVINGSVSYQQTPCSSTQARKDPTLDELNAAEKKRRAASNTTKATAIPAPLSPPRVSCRHPLLQPPTAIAATVASIALK
ncbi:hypothetical protein SAMN05216339_10817 [Nitrosomonas eutropha]|uniref:DUF4124 domain-containing protein n=1 Tax=Nitrosomonas eutropha TaxID=916 RepID=A0A1I7ICL0_9PROT|nr:hypothetical protein SAMN05216339_10817 [Nitrosomonas eutropha]